jgi:hypothetical protein
MYDADYREHTITALETATTLTEQGGLSPGAFVVPTTVSRITEIRIATTINCADDTAFGWTSAAHFRGSGIKVAEGWFPGTCGSVEGIGAASGSKYGAVTQKYLTNIPVNPGGQFSVDGFMLGEDIGAMHMLVQVVYDGPVVGKIRDMDYRSIDLTAANTLVQLTERGAAVVEGDMRPAYDTIGEIFCGAGAKITAAATTCVGVAYHIDGPGLQTAGNYKFISGHSWGLNSEFGGTGGIWELERYIAGIRVKKGNPVRVQAQMIEGDVGTAFSQVGFAYY